MKPLSIADYLDRLGSARGEKAPPRREGSPFRPRSLPSPGNGEPALKPVFDRVAKADGAGGAPSEETSGRTPWAPKPVPLESVRTQPPPMEELAKPEDMSAKLADAYARGREQGLAEGRLEASDRHAAELAAAREQVETQGQEFRRNEYAELEGAIRSGFKQIDDNIGGAVARILAPFLSQQVLSRAVDELAKADRQAQRGELSRVDQDSWTRARACAPARANRRSADRGRICRGWRGRNRRRVRTPPGSSPSFARGRSC